MPLSLQEAAKTLSEAELAHKRSTELYFYQRSSPHLILWGTIWVVGYGGTGLYPQHSNPLWAVLMLVGILGGIWIGRRRRADPLVRGGFRAWRMAALWVIILFFVSATYTIMEPHLGKQFCAFPALITGTVYMAVGLWAGIRYLVSGAAVVVLTLFGFFYMDLTLYFYWMAVVGGGSMILAGIWFRRV